MTEPNEKAQEILNNAIKTCKRGHPVQEMLDREEVLTALGALKVGYESTSNSIESLMTTCFRIGAVVATKAIKR